MIKQSEINHLVDHLFRHESGKLVAVLTRIFSSENMELAEDVVQEALIEAMMQWTYKGIPENPSAWLFKVAKNKTLNIINREKYKRQYSSEAFTHLLQSQWTATPSLDLLFSDREIMDDQLRMMFTCCHPSISTDSQVALTLKTLCGFSIPEIAKAFLTTNENIHKRLVRARKKIREEKISFEVPAATGMEKRLQAILETIYLLFNEGYSASSGPDLIRYEICGEAIRLAEIIAGHPVIQSKSDVYALLALMQLNAARFSARQDIEGNIITLEQQNRSLWDISLMEKGYINLEKSTAGDQLSIYHILAAISAYHCSAVSFESTNWRGILSLYNNLIQIDNSPIILLNRAIAVSKLEGAAEGIKELDKIKTIPALKAYYLFYSTQATLYIELNRLPEAIKTLETAIELAPLQQEKILLKKKMNFCCEKIS